MWLCMITQFFAFLYDAASSLFPGDKFISKVAVSIIRASRYLKNAH